MPQAPRVHTAPQHARSERELLHLHPRASGGFLEWSMLAPNAATHPIARGWGAGERVAVGSDAGGDDPADGCDAVPPPPPHAVAVRAA